MRRWCRPGCGSRDAKARRRRRRFAGRVLGTVSAALMAATLLIGVAMPLVISLLAPGFVGSERCGLP